MPIQCIIFMTRSSCMWLCALGRNPRKVLERAGHSIFSIHQHTSGVPKALVIESEASPTGAADFRCSSGGRDLKKSSLVTDRLRESPCDDIHLQLKGASIRVP